MEFCDANIDKLYWLIKNVDSCARGLNTYILCMGKELQVNVITAGSDHVAGSNVANQPEPENPQNCQNWGVGAWKGMGTCLGQYGNGIFHLKLVKTATFWAIVYRHWQIMLSL